MAPRAADKHFAVQSRSESPVPAADAMHEVHYGWQPTGPDAAATCSSGCPPMAAALTRCIGCRWARLDLCRSLLQGRPDCRKQPAATCAWASRPSCARLPPPPLWRIPWLAVGRRPPGAAQVLKMSHGYQLWTAAAAAQAPMRAAQRGQAGSAPTGRSIGVRALAHAHGGWPLSGVKMPIRRLKAQE